MRRTPANLRSELRGRLSIALNRGDRLLPKQEQALVSDAFIKVLLGAYGSGKTTGACLALLRCAFENPYEPEIHGEDRPMSICVGITMRVLKDSSLREIHRLLPPELIRNEWKAPDPTIELINGHFLRFYSVKGALEGQSLVGLLIDECHLIPNEAMWLNFQARVRDPRARSWTCVLSGIPEDGWLRRAFDKPSDPNRLVIHMSTDENTYLPDHVIAELRKSTSKGDAEVLLGGKWRKRAGVCFHSFDDGLHVIDRQGDRNRPTSLSCDIGDKGAILFVQECERRIKVGGRIEIVSGLHVVDELLPDKVTVQAAMRQAKARGWKIDPRSSVILLDPTSRSDEIASVRSVFGNQIQIIKRKRGDVREQVEYGIDCVNTALCDADDNVRLTFASTLPRKPRSILSAVHQYHRHPKTGSVVKDETSDHSCDALRYACVNYLPLKRGGHRVLDRRG